MRSSHSKPAPVHVAFAAPSTVAVRDFYTAALTAKASPAGSPAYRGEQSDVFNAAIIDLDGNTIEAVYHVGHDKAISHVSHHSNQAVSQTHTAHSHMHNQFGITKDEAGDEEPADSAVELKTPTAKAASQNIPTLSSTLSEPFFRSSTLQMPSKAFAGTLLGAAAGAATLFAMYTMERSSAREEEAFNLHVSHSNSSPQPHTPQYHPSQAARVPAYRRRSEPSVQPSLSRTQHRLEHDYQTTAPPSFRRSYTADGLSSHSSRHHDPVNAPSRRTNYNGIIGTITEHPETYDTAEVRRDSGIGLPSQHSSSNQRSHLYRANPQLESPAARKLLEWRGRHSSRSPHVSSASTARRARSSSIPSAAHLPLPISRAPSHTSARHIPLPPSTTSSRHSGPVPLAVINHTLGAGSSKDHRSVKSRSGSRNHRSSRDQDQNDAAAEIDDLDTVVPEDSISNIGSSHSRRSRQNVSNRSSHSRSGRDNTTRNRSRNHGRSQSKSRSETSESTLRPSHHRSTLSKPRSRSRSSFRSRSRSKGHSRSHNDSNSRSKSKSKSKSRSRSEIHNRPGQRKGEYEYEHGHRNDGRCRNGEESGRRREEVGDEYGRGHSLGSARRERGVRSLV